jgi:hypothetical protein
MKRFFKRLVRNSLQRLIGVADLRERLDYLQKRLEDTLEPAHWGRVLNEVACSSRAVQHLLCHTYRGAASGHLPALPLSETEFRCFSQNGEDGILLYVFALIGTNNKKVVEICAGNGIECNAANLIINQGWFGLLVDGGEDNIARGRRFYQSCRETGMFQPTLVTAWVTAENVNDLVSRHGFAGDIDLLSLDLDGMDYWVWKALTCVRPRVVIVEFNCRWGPERAVAQRYQPDFQEDWNRHPWRHGASLYAFVKLGRQRGYRLIGTNRSGPNALFLRSDTGVEQFPEISAAEAFRRSLHLRQWAPDWLPSAQERPDFYDVVEV